MAGARSIGAWLQLGLGLLLASLPFELFAGVPIAGLTFTNLELLVLVVLGLWVALLVQERRFPAVPRSFVLGAAAVLVVCVSSALLAGPWRGAALKFTARQMQCALLACCLADQVHVRGWPLMRRLGLWLALGSCGSAVLGLLELLELPPVLALLGLFKGQLSLAGGLLRLSASFTYANIAAMYFEIALALALPWVALAPKRLIWLPICGTAILFAAALFTYSRAALVTLCVICVLAALLALVLRLGGARPVSALCGLLLLALVALIALSPTFQVRFAEPDVARWYRAAYRAASLPAIAARANATANVTVWNQGLVPWRSDGIRPTMLSYHWIDADTRRMVRFNGLRTALPRPLAPGETVALDATVQAPDRPGRYLLVWDMVVEHSGWFSELGNTPLEIPVLVAPVSTTTPPLMAPPPAEPAGTPQQIQVRPPPPARTQLWRAALIFWREQPIFGIGPDVFRHMYGPTLGLAVWDDRIHTNNLYLEILAGTGLAGLVATLALGAITALALYRTLAQGTDRQRWAALSIALALLAILIHGTLDVFVEYTATAILLWALPAVAAVLMFTAPRDTKGGEGSNNI